MRKLALVVLLALTLPAVLAQAGTVDPTAVRPYWQQIGNCDFGKQGPHGHRSQVAKRRITELLHAPYVKRQAVRHYNRCVATKRKRRYLTRVVKNGWEWRAAHYWEIRFERFSPSWQAWAHSTAACESDHGRNPRTNLNGFRGIFQWVMSTWYAAGGTGDPAVAGFYHEAVIAIGLAQREGTGHWPRCG